MLINRYPVHEEIIEKIARSVGIQSVSLSSKIMPMMRIVPRGFTAASDAYLTPHIQRYLQVSNIYFFFHFVPAFPNFHFRDSVLDSKTSWQV